MLEGNLPTSTTRSAPVRPDAEVVLLLEPYSYGLRRQARATSGGWSAAMYHVRTAGLVIVDNAYLPVHVAPHRAAHDRRPGLARGRAR